MYNDWPRNFVGYSQALSTGNQSDIEEGGRVFSYAVIVLFNLAGLCLWIVAVGSPTLETLDASCTGHVRHVWEFGIEIARRMSSGPGS